MHIAPLDGIRLHYRIDGDPTGAPVVFSPTRSAPTCGSGTRSSPCCPRA